MKNGHLNHLRAVRILPYVAYTPYVTMNVNQGECYETIKRC